MFLMQVHLKNMVTSIIRNVSTPSNLPSTKDILIKEEFVLSKLGQTPAGLPTYLSKPYVNSQVAAFTREESSKKALQDYSTKVESLKKDYDITKTNQNVERLNKEYASEVSVPQDKLIQKYTSLNQVKKDVYTGQVTLLNVSDADKKVLEGLKEKETSIISQYPSKDYFSRSEELSKYNELLDVQNLKTE